MGAFLTAEEMRRALASSQAILGDKNAQAYLAQPTQPTLTPEQMHEQAHQTMMAANQPGALPSDLAPPLSGDAGAAQGPMQSGDPMTGLALNTIGNAEQDALQAKAKIYKNIEKMDAGFADENRANQELRNVKAAESQAQDPIEQEKTRIAKQNEDAMAAITEKGQIAAKQQMVRLNAAADDAATAEVHNFWEDKSTGARILGILSQAFAGAANGLANNPGAVTPLDRVIQDDLQRQQINLSQKNTRVAQARSVLRDIYSATGNQQQAQAAMYIAAWKRVEQQANEVKNKFGTPEAQAQFDQVSALSKQRQASAKDKILDNMYSSAVQQEQFGMKMLQEQQGLQAAANKPLTGENERIFTLAGTTGEVDNRTYEKVSKADEGYRTVSAQQKYIGQIFADLASGKKDYATALADYSTARSDLLADMRAMQGTGAALSPQELKNVEAIMPDFATASAPILREFLSKTGVEQMRRVSATVGRRFFGRINHLIKGVELNPNDPDYGDAVRVYINEKASQQQGDQ